MGISELGCRAFAVACSKQFMLVGVFLDTVAPTVDVQFACNQLCNCYQGKTVINGV